MNNIIFVALCILAMLCVVVGCNDNAQRGKYSVSTNQTIALEGNPGKFMVLKGNKLDSAYQPVGEEIALLNLVILENLDGTSSSRKFEHGKIVSTLAIDYDLRQNTDIRVSWNRLNEDVRIQDESFKRGDGNTFLVLVNEKKSVEVFQVETANEQMNPKETIDFIRKQLPEQKSHLENVGVHDS